MSRVKKAPLSKYWGCPSRYRYCWSLAECQLEGLTRPHFFRGVATVCTKLFNIIQPERAYFGQKDIQQTVVLRALVRDLHIPVNLKVCPTVREYDGLALSSRNAYLLPSQREDSLTLWRSLKAGQEAYVENPHAPPPFILEAAQAVMSDIVDRANGRITLDYLSFVHPETLQSLSDQDSSQGGILVGAIFLHGGTRTIRLIDNVILT
jgi:pantoate--beta-alanine ligase